MNVEKQIKSQLVYNNLPFYTKWFFHILDLGYSWEINKLKRYLWAKEKPLKQAVIDDELNNDPQTNDKRKWAMARGFKRIGKIEKQIQREFEQKNNKLIDKYNKIKLKWIKKK